MILAVDHRQNPMHGYTEKAFSNLVKKDRTLVDVTFTYAMVGLQTYERTQSW
jgi:hypothetical protein